MSEETKCGQDGCKNPGAFRFTWPGRDESYICAQHAPWMRRVADSMGLHLQLIPLRAEKEQG